MLMPRSYLFVPANRPERIDKGRAAGADAVIVDLEDAVPVHEKDVGRAALAAWLLRFGTPGRDLLVRINGVGTPWHEEDVRLCKAAGVTGVILPKSEKASDLAGLATILGPEAFLLPLVESGAGMAATHEIARAPQVQRLLFGTVDFQLDMGIEGEDLELLYFRSRLVLESNVAGIAAPVDGVTLSTDDEVRIEADTRRGKRLGFGAKLCIHPRQVAAVHRAYDPTAAEIDWAQRVVAGAQAARGAAYALDGKLVDLPVILKAEKILAIVARVASVASAAGH